MTRSTTEPTVDLSYIDHTEIDRRARQLRAEALANGFGALRRWVAALPGKLTHQTGKAA